MKANAIEWKEYDKFDEIMGLTSFNLIDHNFSIYVRYSIHPVMRISESVQQMYRLVIENSSCKEPAVMKEFTSVEEAKEYSMVYHNQFWGDLLNKIKEEMLNN